MIPRLSPQLATPIEPLDLPNYVNRDDIWMEQKLDGTRAMFIGGSGQCFGVNRNNTIAVPPQIETFIKAFPGEIGLDGEMVSGNFWAFDMPHLVTATTSINTSTPLEVRKNALDAIEELLRPAGIRVLPTARTAQEKSDLILRCARTGTEGVLVKDISKPYYCGKRTLGWLKAKYVKSCDAFILQLRIDGKRNALVGVYSNGQVLEIGTVTMTDKRLATAKIGDVLEIRYLYASKDLRLVQPRVLRSRTDKAPSDCLVDQLQFTDKSLIHPVRKGHNPS